MKRTDFDRSLLPGLLAVAFGIDYLIALCKPFYLPPSVVTTLVLFALLLLLSACSPKEVEDVDGVPSPRRKFVAPVLAVIEKCAPACASAHLKPMADLALRLQALRPHPQAHGRLLYARLHPHSSRPDDRAGSNRPSDGLLSCLVPRSCKPLSSTSAGVTSD
jgi:hypothetical protein